MNHSERVIEERPPAPPRPFQFAGHWTSRSGAYIDLVVAGNSVEGSYVTAPHAPNATATLFPITGTQTGDLISWTVNWGSSITAWLGHGTVDEAGKAQVLLQWHLIQSFDTQGTKRDFRDAIVHGTDDFTR